MYFFLRSSADRHGECTVCDMQRIVELFHDIDSPPRTLVNDWLELRGHRSTRVYAYKEENLSAACSGADLLILHGGDQHLYKIEDDPWLMPEIELVGNAIVSGLPVIGFCLGAQIIAAALGAEVYEAPQSEIGWWPVQFSYREHQLLRGVERQVMTFLWHRDHYDLPELCERLASSPAALNQMFYSTQAPALGFQFHPEYSRALIERYHSRYGNTWGHGRYVRSADDFDSWAVGDGVAPDADDPERLFFRLMDNAVAWFQEHSRQHIHVGTHSHSSIAISSSKKGEYLC